MVYTKYTMTWKTEIHKESELWIENEAGEAIAQLPSWLSEVGSPREANAALIVRAVNSHYDLIKALRLAKDLLQEIDADDLNKINTALIKAEGI